MELTCKCKCTGLLPKSYFPSYMTVFHQLKQLDELGLQIVEDGVRNSSEQAPTLNHIEFNCCLSCNSTPGCVVLPKLPHSETLLGKRHLVVLIQSSPWLNPKGTLSYYHPVQSII